MGYENIQFFGNMKHDADILGVNDNKLENLKKSISDKNIILAVSTHNGEEEIIFSLFNRLKHRNYRFDPNYSAEASRKSSINL